MSTQCIIDKIPFIFDELCIWTPKYVRIRIVWFLDFVWEQIELVFSK